MPANPYHNPVLDDDPESPVYTRRETRSEQGFDLQLSEEDHCSVIGRGSVSASTFKLSREAVTVKKIIAYGNDA